MSMDVTRLEGDGDRSGAWQAGSPKLRARDRVGRARPRRVALVDDMKPHSVVVKEIDHRATNVLVVVADRALRRSKSLRAATRRHSRPVFE